MISPFLRRHIHPLLVVVLVCAIQPTALGQNDNKDDKTLAKPTAENVAKAEAILTHAIEALGGADYLNVKTVVGRGFFTTFADGMSQLPARFLDYIAYPDRERTEFTGGGIKAIQTNSGDTGWLYDGATKTLNDMNPKQIDDFKRGMRTSLENLLHGWWRKEGATLITSVAAKLDSPNATRLFA